MLQCICMCFSFPAGLFLLRGIFGAVNALFPFPLPSLLLRKATIEKSMSVCCCHTEKNISPVSYWLALWAYILASSMLIMPSLNKGLYKQMHIAKSVHQCSRSLKPAFAKSTILGIYFKDKALVRLFMQRKRVGVFFLASRPSSFFFSIGQKSFEVLNFLIIIFSPSNSH